MRPVLLALILLSSPATVWANSLVAPGPVRSIANSKMSATPAGEWNRLGKKEGKRVETWTLDGPLLNRVLLFGGVPVGEPLFYEVDKKKSPLPKITANMLFTDIPSILESSYRALNEVSKMTIDTQEPAELNGIKGVRFTYHFVRGSDDVERRGEAVGAFKDNTLYLVVYEAPDLHFFDKDLDRYRQLVATLKF